jgi:Dimethyladenosine transferase (rRNA methylation)
MNCINRWVCRSKKWRTALETKLVPWTLDGAQLGDDALEIGPGPGLTTEILRRRVPQLTVLEFRAGKFSAK